jgi:FixJ family two-component response regulator
MKKFHKTDTVIQNKDGTTDVIFKTVEKVKQASMHPASRKTKREREQAARERYQNATPAERVGMFNPDARKK